MILAVRKAMGRNPTGVFFVLHPVPMQSDEQISLFRSMYYVMIQVSEDEGKRLINDALKSLAHKNELVIICQTNEYKLEIEK